MGASDEKQMDQLADCVANSGSISRCARQIGESVFRAEFLWGRIVSRLGPQAS